MNLSEKTVLVIGLGKSGSYLVKYLSEKAKKVLAFDYSNALTEIYKFEEYKNVKFFLGQNPTGDEETDLVVISPGISLENEFVKKFLFRNIEIIGEVELAYKMSKGKFVGITGTNGKTTTTALTGEIFKNAGFDTRVVGNIGTPIISEIDTSTDKTVFISELSSFQLETIDELSCKSAVIINITPDHLNRHKTVENYAKIKSRVFENQTSEDFAIINLDDSFNREIEKEISAKKIYVSVNKIDENLKKYPSVYLDDNRIVYFDGKSLQEIIQIEKIFLKGKHNYENVVIASAIAISFGINIKVIAKTLEDFRGVSHRLEFVREVSGIKYFNDSKGTNPDASIKAIEAIKENIIIIAGGMDKKSDFDDFVEAFSNSVKSAILLGETKEIIAKILEKFGFKNYFLVENMDEAVKKASEIAQKGDTVLLSPACASWDMYSCFEERGEHFKKLVSELG